MEIFNRVTLLISNKNFTLILIIFLTVSLMYFVPQDTKNELSQTFEEKPSNAKGSRFNLVVWEIDHFPEKWIRKLIRFTSPKFKTNADENKLIQKYIQINHQIAGVSTQSTTTNVGFSDTKVESAIHERNLIINDVEEIIESRVNTVLSEKNIATWGKITFPPVDISLGDTPKVLITSPREKIFRLSDVLIHPNISNEESDLLETRIAKEENLSALISKIGGIATYPSAIPHGTSLDKILTITAHEWFHHYAFFHPLGQNMHDSNSMKTLNETVATLFGEEIALLAKSSIENDFDPLENNKIPTHKKFNFNYEMKTTRIETESLLSKNQIAAAEEYMETRRKLFNQNGYNIRKLNQAWFAFHGTYGESAASISPIGSQVRGLRNSYSSLEEFVDAVTEINNMKEFSELLHKSRVN